MAMEPLRILRGNWEDFKALETKDNNTIYFILDERRIYIGETEFSRPSECISDLSFVTSDAANPTAITISTETL